MKYKQAAKELNYLNENPKVMLIAGTFMKSSNDKKTKRFHVLNFIY